MTCKARLRLFVLWAAILDSVSGVSTPTCSCPISECCKDGTFAFTTRPSPYCSLMRRFGGAIAESVCSGKDSTMANIGVCDWLEANPEFQKAYMSDTRVTTQVIENSIEYSRFFGPIASIQYGSCADVLVDSCPARNASYALSSLFSELPSACGSSSSSVDAILLPSGQKATYQMSMRCHSYYLSPIVDKQANYLELAFEWKSEYPGDLCHSNTPVRFPLTEDAWVGELGRRWACVDVPPVAGGSLNPSYSESVPNPGEMPNLRIVVSTLGNDVCNGMIIPPTPPGPGPGPVPKPPSPTPTPSPSPPFTKAWLWILAALFVCALSVSCYFAFTRFCEISKGPKRSSRKPRGTLKSQPTSDVAHVNLPTVAATGSVRTTFTPVAHVATQAVPGQLYPGAVPAPMQFHSGTTVTYQPLVGTGHQIPLPQSGQAYGGSVLSYPVIHHPTSTAYQPITAQRYM